MSPSWFGLMFALALICGKGRTESVILTDDQDQVPAANENTFSIQIPLGRGNIIQADNQVTPTVQRRLSLEDFFNRNQNTQEKSEPTIPAQVPLTQFQVQQPDPNSLLFVRDAQFPSPTGGLISRLLLARRMLRLRRIARRLTFLPRLLTLGLGGRLGRSALGGGLGGLGAALNPLSLFSNRMGDAYNPRDYVFGNKGFSYGNNSTNNAQSQDQSQQQSRSYPVNSNSYHAQGRDNSYDLDIEKEYDPQELNELKKQQEILNSLTDEQQLLLLQQLNNYQTQLNQLQDQLNSQNQNEISDHRSTPYQQTQEILKNNQPIQNLQPQTQEFNDQQLDQIRQLQLQLLREQQLQQQLQQVQLTQQAQNLKQHQNLASVEQEVSYETNSQQQSSTAGDRTEGSQYSSPIGIGNSAGSGSTIGVGINVGIKPPGLDVQVKPVGSGISGIKPFPPIVNPIDHKPYPPAKPAEELVPIGILPRPVLNLKGRLFFGAEVGKGAGLKVGSGR